MKTASAKKQKELFMLLKILVQGERDIKSNKLIKQENLFAQLDKKYKK